MQDFALRNAQAQIEDLRQQLEDMRRQLEDGPQAPQQQRPGSFLGGLFGSGPTPQPASQSGSVTTRQSLGAVLATAATATATAAQGLFTRTLRLCRWGGGSDDAAIANGGTSCEAPQLRPPEWQAGIALPGDTPRFFQGIKAAA